MRNALLAGALFVVSYVAVNRGLGPNPLRLIVPLAVAIGVATLVGWLGRRGRPPRPKRDSAEALLQDPLAMPPVHPRSASTPPSQPRRTAKRLF